MLLGLSWTLVHLLCCLCLTEEHMLLFSLQTVHRDWASGASDVPDVRLPSPQQPLGFLCSYVAGVSSIIRVGLQSDDSESCHPRVYRNGPSLGSTTSSGPDSLPLEWHATRHSCPQDIYLVAWPDRHQGKFLPRGGTFKVRLLAI